MKGSPHRGARFHFRGAYIEPPILAMKVFVFLRVNSQRTDACASARRSLTRALRARRGIAILGEPI